MKPYNAILQVLLLLLPTLVNADPVKLYVDTTGNDAALGTITSPVASLQGARDRLRDIRRSQGLQQGAIVTFNAGTYTIQEAVTFSPLDSGT